MIPMNNSSNIDRRALVHSSRRPLARSNSSLLGSFKNFVAAPFARLFTGTANEFDDPNDFSGKRRLIVNQTVDNNDIIEDGPAPAKRMRVRSPSPPPRSAGYLDPPSSAFHLNNNNINLSSNPPSRSASISLPPTTLPPTNTRSTISPLRNHFSRTMSIDAIPSSKPRPLSRDRDISMKSISSIPIERSISMRAGSRDSLPPPGFRMRESLTPQPHAVARQPIRDLSEPPPVTALHSNPVFVRGPSQPLEPQPQPRPTLGSLVDSQRSLRSPGRQRTLLFGSSQPADHPQAVAAERTLHELDFYKTPLVPTRIRSRLPNGVTASASSSNLTDMFARRHSLVLMGDHDRPRRGSKKDKKTKSKEKGKGKEANDTKPYAGITGIKKRLAKAKDVSGEEKAQDSTTTEEKTKDVPQPQTAVPDIPLPLPTENDTFNVAAFPPKTLSVQQSSLRVGRAARTHLSRPAKKFSAAYDEDDDKPSDETQRDMEMLAEAAKKIPTFEIPANFSFAQEAPPIAPASEVTKEPPISSLPFSLTKPAASVPPSDQAVVSGEALREQIPSETSLFAPSAASLFGGPTASSRPAESFTASTEASDSGKVPNFFASSKVLGSQTSTHTPPLSIPLAPSVPVASSPFSFVPAAADKGEVSVKSSLSSPPSASTTPTPFSFGAPQTSSLNPTVVAQEETKSLPFSFGTPAVSQPAPFSLSKPTESSQLGTNSAAAFSLGAPASTTATTDSTPKATPFSFGAPSSSGSTPSASLFGSSEQTPKSTGSLFGGSSESAKPTSSSLFSATDTDGSAKPTTSFSFGASTESSKSAAASPFSFSGSAGSVESTKPATPFSFGTPSESSKTASSLFGSPAESAKPSNTSLFSFGQSSAIGDGPSAPSSMFGAPPTKPGDGNVNNSGPFSFGAPSSGTSDQPKSLFGNSSDSMSDGNKSAGFTFGSSASGSTGNSTTTSTPFSFAGGSGSSAAGTSGPFAFGVTPARAVTPPPNQDQEVRMEESPTREVKPVEQRPSLSGFSFNSAPTTSTMFGNNTPSSSTGFSFGQTSSNSNPFGAIKTDDKPSENKPFGMQANTSSPFSFGRTAENDPPRPSTTGSFSFGSSSSSSNTGPGPTFSFGAPSNNAAPSNPFGQSTSTPSSPSTFNQGASFAFGAAAPSSSSGGSNPFMFGSQPASPATPNPGLPSSGFGSATPNPFGAPAQSNTGFGTPSAPPAGGGSLFTIGAPPADSGRQIKKLPNRTRSKR